MAATVVVHVARSILHKRPPISCLPDFTTNASKAGRLSFTAPGHAHLIPMATTQTQSLVSRRSGNYKPPLWTFDYIQSLSSSEYEGSESSARASSLVKQVKMLLDEEMETTRQLELIDDLKRLGLCYHFEDKIDQILGCIYAERYDGDYTKEKTPLYSTALEFRLLREHGLNVPQEVFDCYKNEAGDFDPILGDDAKGLLQLYEASYLSTPGEQTLELAKEFASGILHEKLEHDFFGFEGDLSLQVRRALELPCHWRIQWPNARWFIDAYSTRPDSNPTVLELAKLNFNILQATHLQELKHASTWWKQTGLAEALPFARDRIVENYFWTLGMLFETEYGNARKHIAKINAMITVIDDIFDVYGTLEELKLFNKAIQSWDLEAVEKLPKYMKVCYLALNNLIDEIAYDVLKEQGLIVINHIRKSWADLCSSYLQEAEWFSGRYTPKMGEYLNNAWLSVSAYTILSQIFFLVVKPIEKEAVESIYKYHDIIVCSGMILRLANDIGTSSLEVARGDVPKSIECYMEETGASREEAREHVRHLIDETWKRMNEQVRDCGIFSKKFKRCAMDVGRIAQYMYDYGDGHGENHPHNKDRISDLLFNHIL